MVAVRQTSAQYPSSGKTCTVTLAVEDALGIGYSIRALVKQSKMPSGTAATYLRVAMQMIAAAKLEVLG